MLRIQDSLDPEAMFSTDHDRTMMCSHSNDRQTPFRLFRMTGPEVHRLVCKLVSGKQQVTRLCGLGFLAALASLPTVATAQTSSNVYGPTVTPGDKTPEYRIAWFPDAERWIHRAQYQQALTDNLRLRGVLQLRHGEGRDGLEFDNSQLQLLWQVTPDDQNWQSAFRFDVQIRGQGRPDRLRVHWANQFDLGGNWRALQIILFARELGTGRIRGLSIQSRSAIGTKLNSRARLDMQHFATYGSTKDILAFGEQSQQLGPQLSFRFDQGWRASFRGLFGLNGGTDDAQFRLQVRKSF